MPAYGELVPHGGGSAIIEDEVIRGDGALVTDIDDFFLKEDASTVQIFFLNGIPNDPGGVQATSRPRVFTSFITSKKFLSQKTSKVFLA